MTLVTMRAAAALLACRDPRTAAKRLAALGVPVVTLPGGRFVDDVEIARAIRAHARPRTIASPVEARRGPGRGVRVAAPDALWDAGKHVGPRRVSARARGSRVVEHRAAREAYPGTPEASLVTSSTVRPESREDRDDQH